MEKYNSNLFFILANILIVGALFYLLKSILTPFIIAWVLAFLFYPIIRYMQRFIPKWFAIFLLFSVIIFLIILFVILLLPHIENQINHFIENLPVYSERAYNTVAIFDQHLNIKPTKFLSAMAEHLESLGTALLAGPKHILDTASTFLEFLMDIMIVPIVTYYLLYDWKNLSVDILGFFPAEKRDSVDIMLTKSSYILRRFLHGELLVMLVVGIVYSIGYEIANVPLALPLGILAGLICTIPFASLLLAALPAFIFSLIAGDLFMLSIVMTTIFMAEFLNNLVLTPILVGKYVNIHPVMVLLLVLSGGVIYGVIGMILALPIAAIITYVFLNRETKVDVFD
jgi:predicted PurR-regulated permease PerM